MYVIKVRSVEDAYVRGREIMDLYGIREESRNGPVMVAPWPVTTVYEDPTDRVLLNRARKSNHAFHINEAIWMLSGSNDARWLDQFIHNFSSRYAREDGTMDGAYGFRWRKHFGKDQLEEVIYTLGEQNNSRRAVIAMHDPIKDLNADTKDQPCNTHIYLRVRAGALEMTVLCRSNDIIWGAYGANAVHFSVLQEYLAAAIGVKVGTMYQVSNNWHTYVDTWRATDLPNSSEYWPNYKPVPLVNHPYSFIRECEIWTNPAWGDHIYLNTWFVDTLYPIRVAFNHAKNKNFRNAHEVADNIKDFKWRKGMIRWIEDREAKWSNT